MLLGVDPKGKHFAVCGEAVIARQIIEDILHLGPCEDQVAWDDEVFNRDTDDICERLVTVSIPVTRFAGIVFANEEFFTD